MGERNVIGRFQHPLFDFLRGLNTGIDRVGHADEDAVMGSQLRLDDLQYAGPVALAGQLEVEVPHVELEEMWQQLGVVHVRAVGRVPVAAGAAVHADDGALLGREAIERPVVQGDKALQELFGRIEFDRQPPLREVDLDVVGAGPQRAANVGLMLPEKIAEKRLSGIAVDGLLRVEQAQGRSGNDRLLDGHLRIALRRLQITIGIG